MPSTRVELLRQLFARWALGDFRGGRELVDPDIEFILDPRFEPSPSRGPEELSGQLREFLANWIDYRVEAEEFVDAGDKVLVRSRQRGVGTQSAVEVEAPHFSVWTFRRGKVVRLEFFLDEQEARRVAGLQDSENRADAGDLTK